MSPAQTATAPASPRKQARQARSRQTVNNILEACELLISEKGLETLTTNRIAERAGVNIASLYQYFPNKEAVVNSLLMEKLDNESAAIAKTIQGLQDKPSIREAAKDVIRLALRIFRQSEALFLAFLQTPAFSAYFDESEPYTRTLVDTGKAFLRRRQSELRVKDIDKALYVLSNSVVPLLVKHLSRPAMVISDAEMVDEVSDLIGNYLLE